MPLRAGTSLGPYVVEALIGAGGMGEVYRARDPRLGREVAIKVLSAALDTKAEWRQRFEQEARAAAALNHPNIIAVHDVGSLDGAPYIVSELLVGTSLRERLAAGPLPPALAIEHAKQIGQGLAAAHEKGIVHRDLKPENIFVTADGRVKVLDFGLARLLPPAVSSGEQTAEATFASPTRAGTLLGTAGYMAPEQVRGEPADPRADIFALGAVLYEMLAGRRAFAGASAIDSMTAVLRDDPPAFALETGIAPALERVVRRCLEKRPEDRFQSVRDLGFALGESSSAPLPAAEPARAPIGARRWLWGTLGAAALAGSLLLAIVLMARGERTVLPARIAPITSLAVLPLANLSNDPEQDYFADGMTAELIGSLQRMGSVRVISRTSAMTFKSTRKRLPDIARELAVDAIVEAAVSKADNRVRINVTLFDARSESPLWTDSYDRDLRDVLALQADLARAIAREIRATLTPQETTRFASAGPVDPDAHELYLRGRFFLAKATEASIDKAIQLFTQAARRDPSYAAPHAGLADAYTLLRSTYLPPHVVMPKAKAAAARALELDPALAEAHVSMGGVFMYYDYDWSRAEQELKAAMGLSPNLADAHDAYALYLAAAGRHDEARAESERAQALDPLSLLILDDAGWIRYLGRDYAGGLAALKKAIDMDPGFWPAHRDLGLVYEKLGRHAEAVAELETARKLDRNPSILEMLGAAYVAWGKPAEARKVLDEMTERARSEYVCPYEVATVFASLGDRKQTMQWLERGVAERADCIPWAHSDAKLDSMRDYPGFAELLQRVGLRH
jgi:eukaryotic-like serine/threonine-protein kinase